MSDLRTRLNNAFSSPRTGKVIDVELDVVKEYLRIDFDDDDVILALMLDSAKGFVKSYTKQSEEELAELPEIKMAVLLIVSHYYDNRIIDPTSKQVDFILKQTLGMHHLYDGGGII